MAFFPLVSITLNTLTSQFFNKLEDEASLLLLPKGLEALAVAAFEEEEAAEEAHRSTSDEWWDLLRIMKTKPF